MTAEWMGSAACRAMPSDLWFPGPGGSRLEAAAMCSVCPVKPDCADHADAVRADHGIWAGVDRATLRAHRPATEHVCRVCVALFTGKSSAVYCSDDCRRRAGAGVRDSRKEGAG